MKNKKKLLPILAAVVAIIVFLATMNWDLEHIEDTNGPDNYRLTTITDRDIIEQEMGALRPYGNREALVGDGIVIGSNKFTGVAELFYNNYFGNSDVVLDLSSFCVKEGNFELAVIHDGEIIEKFIPDEFGTIDANIFLEDINGHVSIVIAGESADYSFTMSAVDYEEWESLMKQ